MEKKCNICGKKMTSCFTGFILKKYTIQYFTCTNCGYTCTENPYWLKESYENPINSTDTGILWRNIKNSKIVSCILFVFFSKNKKFLDYGGGYGILTRLMRDIGFDFYWTDPHTQNLFAQGFEYQKKDCEMDVITSFENFEHFIQPIEDLEKMLSISQNILFSTDLLPNPLPKPDIWWYYGLEHGQHISFYSQQTLKTMAGKFEMNCYSCNNYHLFTKKKINKLVWIGMHKFYWLLFPFIRLTMFSKTMPDMESQKKSGGK
jgi:hypothetical protein